MNRTHIWMLGLALALGLGWVGPGLRAAPAPPSYLRIEQSLEQVRAAWQSPQGEDVRRAEGWEALAAALEEAVARHPANDAGRSVLGLIDFESGQCFTCALKDADPLASAFPGKPRAWRTLDVALVQHLIVERICEPKLNGGGPVKWAFPHSVDEALEIGSGAETGALLE